VIIPAYNEEDALPAVLVEVRRDLPDMDVLVVDDGSTDDTRHVAREAGARVIALPFNLGVGGALRTGFRYACDHGYERAVQIDADGQHEAASVRLLLAGLDDDAADLVIGNRFAAGEKRMMPTRAVASQASILRNRTAAKPWWIQEGAGVTTSSPSTSS
jgi:glycosyltransferase involved in cell wall biosynthesis